MITISKKTDNSNKSQGKNIIIIVLTIIAAAAVAVAAWTLLSNKNADAGDKQEVVRVVHEDGTSETIKVLTDAIDLPQFAWLDLDADAKEQDLTFQNPPQNFANIRVSILLPDRTVLWTSGIIAPGEESEKVVLSQELSAGEYKNAILKYECFNNDEALTPLNGSENTLSLKVH